MQEKINKYIKSFIMDAVVAFVSFAYILYQMVTLKPTDLNPFLLIAQSLLGIICGVIIKQGLGENGFSRGYNSSTWIEEKEKYDKSCNSAIEYMPYVDNFYLYLEKEKKENYRRIHLQEIRLRYQDWFDDEGNYIGSEKAYNELTFKQKYHLNKCIKVKINILNLFSEYAITNYSNSEKELTDKGQRVKNISKNVISATFIAVSGVYFIPVLNGWDWASVIASTMQVALWIMFGIIQLYMNYNFVVQNKVSLLRKKKEYIAKFADGCRRDLYKTSPYSKKEKVEKKFEAPLLLIYKDIEETKKA